MREKSVSKANKQYIPVLFYGLEACLSLLLKSQHALLYFVVSRFFMKLFNSDIEIVKACQSYFAFERTSVQEIRVQILGHRLDNRVQ